MVTLFNALLSSQSICSVNVGNLGSTNKNRMGKKGIEGLGNLLQKT